MKSLIKVPFNKPVYFENQHAAILEQALRSGHLSGGGSFSAKAEAALQKISSKQNLLVTSGTHALEMMPLLLNFQPGDEVILPSYTFSSTANAFALRGARLRFADNDRFGNILLSEVERLYTKKTKAVMAVHYAGASADMDQLLEFCLIHKINLVEDAAQAIGSSYKNKPLGAIGSLGCYSFHETKNVSAGEGGSLILGDEKFCARAEIFREKGTNRRAFFQGLVDKYTWVDLGSSYVLSDLNAAYLLPQLERFDEIQNKRRMICERYLRELQSDFDRLGIEVLKTPVYNTANYHLFAVLFVNEDQRNKFISFMRSEGVICPFHYIPLHHSPFGIQYSGDRPDELNGCEYISRHLVRFPLYYNMTDEEQSYVIDRMKVWFKNER